MPVFFRRRSVWLPTAWGCLVLVLLVAGLGTTAVRLAYPFLASSEPAHGRDGGGAATLVVEGWLDATDLDRVAGVLQGHRYERVLTSGGPVLSWSEGQALRSSAERAATYLRSQGLASVPVIAVPAPATAQDRTFLSAVMVREWARSHGVTLEAIDLFTSGVHARRSRTVFRLALGPTVEVGVYAAEPADYDAERWWKSSAGAKAVVGEGINLLWTTCCFWPPEAASGLAPSTVPLPTAPAIAPIRAPASR